MNMTLNQAMQHANYLLQHNQLDQAEGLLRQIAAQMPDNADALVALTAILVRKSAWNEAIPLAQRAVQLSPDNAWTHVRLGDALAGFEKYPEALREYEISLKLQPDLWDAIHNIGYVLTRTQRLPESLVYFQRCLDMRPDDASTLINSAIVLRRLGRIEESYELAKHANAIAPNLLDGIQVMADVLLDLRRFEEAETWCEQGLKMAPSNPRCHLVRARILLHRGELIKGFREYEWRLAAYKHLQRNDFNIPHWTGGKVAGKTVLLYPEQGIGDTIQFCRYAKLLYDRGASVVVECPQALRPLMMRVPGVSWVVLPGAPKPPYELRASVLSLPLHMGTTINTIPANIPYMLPAQPLIDFWKEKTREDTARLRVGLCWQGRPTHEEDARRSMRLSEFLPLAKIPGVSFYSLQKGFGCEQLQDVVGQMNIIDLTHRFNDLADTAALIANLDLVITIDSAIAHLSGAMGKRVWTLLPFTGEWRWLMEQETTPWYPTMKLWRQKKCLEWAELIARVATALPEVQSDRP